MITVKDRSHAASRTVEEGLRRRVTLFVNRWCLPSGTYPAASGDKTRRAAATQPPAPRRTTAGACPRDPVLWTSTTTSRAHAIKAQPIGADRIETSPQREVPSRLASPRTNADSRNHRTFRRRGAVSRRSPCGRPGNRSPTLQLAIRRLGDCYLIRRPACGARQRACAIHLRGAAMAAVHLLVAQARQSVGATSPPRTGFAYR
jgi:hypothetical protein